MKIAKINFELIGKGKSSSKVYFFNTEIESLKRGDLVLVDSNGEETYANFLGYVKGKCEIVPTKAVIRKLSKSETMDYWRTVELKLVSRPLKMTDEVYKNYIREVSQNRHTTRNLAELKMTRNLILAAKKKRFINKNNEMSFEYGRLHFKMKNGLIVAIKNYQETPLNYKKNLRHYYYLNDVMGINKLEKI